MNCKNAEISGVTPVAYCKGVIESGKEESEHMLCTSATYAHAKCHTDSGAPVRSNSFGTCSLRYLIATVSTLFC